MRIWLLSLLFFLVISGCATLPLLPPETPSPEFLLHQIRTRLQTFEGLKGLAQVKVSAAEKSFQAQEVLFVRRPGWLRAESLGPLGTPQFYLVTDGRELSLYNPGENRYYWGWATAKHLSLALPLALEPEEVVSLLLGDPLLIDYDYSLHSPRWGGRSLDLRTCFYLAQRAPDSLGQSFFLAYSSCRILPACLIPTPNF